MWNIDDLSKIEPKMKWVPEQWRHVYEQMDEHGAWYSGDTEMIGNFYSSKIYTPSANGRFWGETVRSDDNRTVVHVPIAGDIATFSADLLFSEPPDIRIPEADDESKSNNKTGAKKAQERLDEIIRLGDVVTKLLEAGETSAGMGGVYLKPTWDSELADYPLLTIAQPDNALPVFKYGILVGVIFHKIVREEKGGKIYRLLELYRKGTIQSGLFEGDDNIIGKRIGLDSIPETEGIEEIINTEIDDILTRYIPNKRPHKRFRGTSLGMSDFQGAESLMDALDMTMTSWIRDIALARARIHVPEGMMDNDGKGGVSFDAGQELYVEMDIDPSMLGEGKGLTATQFAIRTDEHLETATNLTKNILHMAGYSPQSFGLYEAGGNLSTESHEIRERKTLITKQKKERNFKEGLADVLQMLLKIDNIHLGNDTPTEFRPNVTFADTLGHDIGAVAKTVQMIQTAKSASIKTRVKMLHPDWTDDQVEAEIEAIREEAGDNVDDPINIGGQNRF